MIQHYAKSSWLYTARLTALSFVCLALAACSSAEKGTTDAGTWPSPDTGVPNNGLAGAGGTGGILPTGGTGGVTPTGGTGGILPTGGTGGATGGTGGTGGTIVVPDAGQADAEADSGETDAQTPVGTKIIPDRCNGDASKTAMIGDSYLALSGDITRYLEQLSGQTYRHYYVSGTQMVGGISPNIPAQAEMAIQDGPVQTFIMDGGGNDVLIGDLTCMVTGATDGSACQATVQKTLEASKQLIQTNAAKGVQETIFFFYPHIPNQMLAGVVDYAAPLAKDVCESATALDCTFIDTRDAFEGHSEYIGVDGIHPTAAGSEVIANLIWDAMQENCANGIYISQ